MLPNRIPAIPSLALILCAAGMLVPNLAAASDLAWTRSGPEGGEVNTLAVHPDDASIVFAGTVDGVYRSDDGGQSWSRKSEGIGSRTAKAIVINPQRTDEMFVLVWGDGGLFKSVDGGETWLPLGFGEERDIRILRYSPTPFVLYVIDEYDLFISADSGESWVEENIDTGFDQIHDLAVHPIHPQYMVVATSSGSGGVAISEDGGRSWRDCRRSPHGVYNVAFDPVDPEIVYFPERDMLYRSNDGCREWDFIAQSGMSPFGFLLADPNRPRTLYHSSSNGVVVSSNGGNDWRRYGPSIEPPWSADMAFGMGGDSGRVYLAAEAMDERRGVFHSDDGGLTWGIGKAGLFANSVGSIELNPADQAVAYAGANNGFNGNGIFKTWDSGNTWSFLDGTEESGRFIAVDPLEPNIVYATTLDWGILKSTDGGETWFEVWGGLSGRRIGGIEVDHHQPGTLYLVFSEDGRDAYRSRDGGLSWTEMALPENAWAWGIHSDPRTPGVVYLVSAKGVHKSFDLGYSWSPISTGLEPSDSSDIWGTHHFYYVNELAFDPTDPQLIYASTEMGPRRSSDGGQTWEDASGGILIRCFSQKNTRWADNRRKTSSPIVCEGGSLGLAIDPDRPSTLFTSTSLGTYRSYNRGERWELITDPEDLNAKSIYALGDGLLMGNSYSAGVLRLKVPPIPSPRRPGHRALPQGSATSKAGVADNHD